MKKRTILSVVVSIIFCVPFLVFASDNSPTGTQASGWSGIEYTKIILSGAAGGLISSLFSIYITWESNENALRINREKIKADQVAQDKNYKNQITKLRYEEMRKACGEFLAAVDPGGIIDCSVDIKEVLKRRNLLTIICEYEYNIYVKRISGMLIDNKPILFSESRPSEVNTVEHAEMLQCINNYSKFFNVFSLVTKDMLDGFPIHPAGEWDIMDYENSIPLDYKQRVT